MVLLHPARNTSTTFSRVGLICNHEDMVVGRSDLLQSPGEMMLGNEGVDLLLRRHAAHNMFDEMSAPKVIWDEEEQHMFEHHGLLKQLTRGSNYFVGEEQKPNAEAPTYDVLTHVSGSSCLLELDIESVPEFDEIHLEDNHATIPESVQFMESVTSKGDAQEVFDGTRTDVIWDMEVQHNPYSHGLLPQLVDDQVYLDVEAMMSVTDNIISVAHGSSSFLEYNQANTDQMADEIPKEVVWDEERLYSLDPCGDYLQQDSLYREYWFGKDKPMPEATIDNELNHDRDTHFLLALHMDHVDEMSASPASLGMNRDLPSVCETHGMLLQQLAWDRKHFDYEMRNSIVEIVLEDVLFDVSDPVCISELFIDSHLMSLKYKKAYIPFSQWDPGIWQKGTTSAYEIYRMFQRQWDPGILKWLRILFELQSWNGEDLNEQGKVPVSAIFNVLVAGQELNFGNVTLVIYEGWQGAIGLQVIFAELQPWCHSVFISTKVGTICYRYISDVLQSWRLNGFNPVSCELNRQLILIATILHFYYKASKSVSFTGTYQMYKNTCMYWRVGTWYTGIWKDACWLNEEILPEISHANVSTLSEKTDNMLFEVGYFRPRGSEQLDLCMITLIQSDLSLVEFYESNYWCPANTRLIQLYLGPACQMVVAGKFQSVEL